MEVSREDLRLANNILHVLSGGNFSICSTRRISEGRNMLRNEGRRGPSQISSDFINTERDIFRRAG